MHNPLLSIVIPIYNVEDQIEKCAISLFRQTLKNIEYIFVNDATPDNSIKVLEKTIDKFPDRRKNIHIINHEINRGLSAARLTGILEAKGTYIAHCDSDDWVEDDMYEKMINKAHEEKADIICCGLYYDSGVEISEDSFKKSISDVDKKVFLSQITLGGKYSSLCNKIVMRDLYFDNNIFPVKNISMWEDMVVTFRLICCSKKTTIMESSYYHYVFKADSISSPSVFSKQSIQQQVKCAEVIEDFLNKRGKNELELLKITLSQIKFISKSQYLTNNKTQDPHLWKITFPESNKYIWKYKGISVYGKIFYTLASMGLMNLSIMILNVILKIKSR